MNVEGEWREEGGQKSSEGREAVGFRREKEVLMVSLRRGMKLVAVKDENRRGRGESIVVI